eukprot:CAMPEP_0195594150 /NCGR_PEP_ID=MMETSP0815-20121206/1266_1 /TAXON_ID=97485 /ORGANISM="Prymnesium parvum, Strain Texoma1" /LENGTH=95 /DNA_ID=CAMNT_0040733341 /DNA_START=352 /DNA_END=636 /DNA_ORIENTATION=-
MPTINAADATPPSCIEAGAKRELKDLVTSAQSLVLLDVLQLIPDRGGGRIAALVQHRPRWQHVLWQEPQVLLNPVEHGPPARVDTEEINRCLEVG